MKTFRPNYITKLDKISQLNPKELKELSAVTDKFAFRTNSYYQQLIDWNDPDDPIRRLVIPDASELEVWGKLDASEEHSFQKVPGLEHKYQYTALMLINDVCGAYCRFCFRKRLFMDTNDEVVRDISEGIEYIKEHKEISNVLLTGGDPLVMSTRKLDNIVKQVADIKHVKIIRLGSKMPAFNPYRIINDPDLVEMFSKYSNNGTKIYLMAHFNHPRELTKEAILSMNLIQKAGAVTVNQTPILKGINDNPEVLAELFNQLSYAGIPPYYVFQCRPTAGNKEYAVPVEKGLEIFEHARMQCSGLAKRARFVMSHATGKVEILGMTDEHIFIRYHRAANPEEKARFMVFRRDPEAYWLDDYVELIDDYDFENPFVGLLYEEKKGA
ncbi:MAG: KamA family radical SAM protein [Calditrichia bacterium]